MVRFIVGSVLLASVACSRPTEPVHAPTEPVHSVATTEQAIRVLNRTAEPIYYFAIERNMAALALWQPCNDPATCPSVPPGESRSIPYSEITGYTPAAETVLVNWWHLHPTGDGAHRAGNIGVVRVALDVPAT